MQVVPNLPQQQSTELTIFGNRPDDENFRSTNSIPEYEISHPRDNLDPLQVELEMMRNKAEQAIKEHEETVCADIQSVFFHPSNSTFSSDYLIVW